MINSVNKQLLIEFATHGYEFFPLIKPQPGRKLGTPKGWPDMGTDDLAVINTWLTTAKYGFGMTFSSCKYFAFDLDGEEGIRNFEKAMVEHNIPTPSVSIKTPSGGRHLLYKYPEGIHLKNIAGWCFNKGKPNQHTKIDIRAEGGFIGSFGARENGYTLVAGSAESELVDVPEGLSLPVRKARASLMASSMSLTKDLVSARESGNIASSLYGSIPERIHSGDRDNTLFNLVASWVRIGLSKDNIMILLAAALERCDGDPSDIPAEDMVDRTLGNPDFVFAKRSNSLQSLLKVLVFCHDINRYATLHDKSVMSKSAVEGRFSNVMQEIEMKSGKNKMMPVFTLWERDESRMMVAGIGYKPGADDIYLDTLNNKRFVNLYNKPDIKSIRNDILFAKFIDFAKTIVGDNDEKGRTIVEYIAYLIQKPSQKIGVAPVIISTKQGVGKNFFLKIVSKLLGESNVTSLHSDNITSNFNSAMAEYQLVVINESVGDDGLNKLTKSKNAQAMSRIKSMITETNQAIEKKGIDIVNMKTYANFMFFSNDISAISMSMEDRRFKCFINEAPPKTRDYFNSMDILKTKEGLGAIKYGLKELKLTRINDHMTSYEKSIDDLRVINSSLTPMEQEIQQDVDAGLSIFCTRFISKEIFMMYMADRHGENVSMSMCGKMMRKFYEPLRTKKKSKNNLSLKLNMPVFTIERDVMRGGVERTHFIFQRKSSGLSTPLTGDQVDRDVVLTELQRAIDHFESEKVKTDMRIVK